MEKRNYIIENFDVNSYFPFDKDYKVSNNLKFNRGVVGISKDGSIQEYILDFVPNITIILLLCIGKADLM